jgi:ferredoxin
MKTTIFYFSGTGNSLKVARDLATELGNTEVIPIAEAINRKMDLSAERIGIVFPVYAWGMPLIVVNFLKKLKTAQYIYAVATYGRMPGGALKQTANLLKSQGMKLSAGFGIAMPGNYTPLYGAIPVEKQQKMFKKEKDKIKDIAEIVKESRESKIERSFFLINWVFSDLLYRLFSPKIPTMDKSFWVDDNCDACGICQKVCPVNNIEILKGKPTWLHKCEQCMACLQWCPKESIQSGKSTPGRKRYRNPEVKLEDFTH